MDLVPRCGIVRGPAEISLAQPRIRGERATRAFQNNAADFKDVAAVPFVIEAMMAWCSAYSVDRNFWAEKNFGSSVCAWRA